MSNIDEQIKQALSEQESKLLEAAPEPGYFELAFGLFRGRLGWISWLVMVVQATAFVFGVWFAFRLFASTDVLEAVKYGFSAAVLILVALQVKLSLMPQMQADRVLREIKRLELLLLNRQG